jgi:hypothetical protein
VAKAEKELGWKPRPITEWYPVTVAFFEGDEADAYEAGHEVGIKGAPFNDEVSYSLSHRRTHVSRRFYV